MKDVGTVELRQQIQCDLCGAEYVIETVVMVGRNAELAVWCAFCGHRGRRAVEGGS